MRTVVVSWILSDGREVEIEAQMAPAEHDVGIMTPYPVGWCIIGEETVLEELPPELDRKLVDAYYEQCSLD